MILYIKYCYYLIKLLPPVMVVVLLALSLNSRAQYDELSTRSKKAKKDYEKGVNNFRVDNLVMAEFYFREAIKEDPDFFEAHILLGEVYEQRSQDSSAIRAYRNAISLDSGKYPRVFLIIADLEYGIGWYEDARNHYQTYLTLPVAHGKNRVKAEKNLTNCDFAIEALSDPVPFSPMNLGPNVNSSFDEYFPCLTADSETLLFTRLLTDPESYTGRQEDFFVSYRNEQDWTNATDIGPPINTKHNEGAPTLSVDGNILVFTACESIDGYGLNRKGYGRCDLFVSKKHGSIWRNPYNIGAPVNSRYWESQPALSSDGRSLYFVSNRSNNYDIWYTRVDNEGVWSEPEKLGDNINTDGYEGSVFIHPDNQTLYFSSDGHIGMGGLDLFVSRRDPEGHWGKAVNLGYPINTHKDENSIVINADGQLAMFASDREDGYGGLDLYGFELYEEVRPQQVTYMKGIVFDAKSGQKLEARFELTDLNTSEVVVQSFSNKGSGEFLVCLPANHDFALTVSKDGYLFYSENFKLSGNNNSNDPVLKDVPLEPIIKGAKVVLKNIFFETDKYELKEVSEIELNKLIDFMANNPTVKIEIGGYTDNVGSPEYNIALSKNRAKSVNDFLVSKGIDQVRVIYKGYGESNPVASNDTESGRAENRRTEFKLIE